ncbi:MAG: hypothetical protein QF819_03415 [Gemmatimonadota bacterium]|jgi:hypothetical protein|nr:hypothetical protein [Gemmatimonadota bacterium]MDP6802210.1 hypothetical protein [Gemmatimonadota bacterium]MDP7032131.1 hypothetical protein [Gemmatimonadota bacterium]
MTHDRNQPPGKALFRDLEEEALILTDWGRGGSADPFTEGADLPEAVLGLLDGTPSGKEAEAARTLLASDPDLARRFGELVAALRETGGSVDAHDAPAALLREAVERVPAVADSPARRSWSTSLREMMSLSPGWTVAGVAATAALVLFFVRSAPLEHETPAYRAARSGTSAVVLHTPEDGGLASGPVTLSWEPVAGAVEYRVVLHDLKAGKILEAGRTGGTTLLIDPESLGWLESGSGITWVIHVRTADGSHASSAPSSFRWSPSR